MSLAAGTRLGSYEITGLLGAGGMGEVYPGERMTLEEGYRRERERLASEREAKIEKTRQATSRD